MAEYLSIDALSATPVRTLLDECPRAGWWSSRLNPNRPAREEAEVMDIGTVAHSILLDGNADCCVIIDPNDYPAKTTRAIPRGWTNDAIRGARDEARAAGKQPILKYDFAAIEEMVVVAKEFIGALRTTEPAIWRAFQPDGGHSETTMVWQEGDIPCKLRTDRTSADFAVTVDYKTSGMSIAPDTFVRALVNMGYAFGAGWYRRGIKALTGVDTSYLFLAQETEAPYLCSLIGLDPSWVAYADQKARLGMLQWAQCVRSGEWPAYPPRACYPELPVWESARLEEKLIGIPYEVGALFERTDDGRHGDPK